MPLEPDQNPLGLAVNKPMEPDRVTRHPSESTDGPESRRSGGDFGTEVQSTSIFDELARKNRPIPDGKGLRLPDDAAGDALPTDVRAATVTMTAPSPPGHERVEGSGRAVGPYLLIQRLGSGSQGEVWRALQVEPIHRTVALKILWHHGSLNVEAAERMRKEAERGGRLSHQTILPVLNFGLEGDLVYIAMPLVEGFTLSQVIATRRAWLDDKAPADLPRLSILPEAAYLKAMTRLLERVARALAHAHDHRIVHRDVKPSNILVDRDDDQRVFLADFGLARDLDDITIDTLSEPGTLIYMSPERLRGQGNYDESRADIFSMGATLFEAVMLKRAFNVPSDLPRSSWPSYLVGQSIPSPRKLNSHLPRDLAAIIEMAMEPNPGRRYESAAALADDLENFVQGRPVRARPPGPVRRLARWVAGQPTVKVALGLAAVLLIASGLALLSIQINRSRAQSNFVVAQSFVRRGQILEAYAAYDRGLQQSPHEPEAARVREEIAAALRSKVLELAEGDDVEPLAELLPLYRKVNGTDRTPVDALSRRLGLRTLELSANAPDATWRIHPIRTDGRPRLDRLLHERITDNLGSPVVIPEIVPGRYWLTLLAPDGEAFDERPILVPPSGNVSGDKSFRVILSPRPGPPTEMVRINGGEFRMGRDLVLLPVDGPPVLQPEMPASEVIVPGFYLDATEVTNAEFTEFLKVTHHEDWASEIWPGVGHSQETHSKWPVTHVKYEQALAYAAWRGCRLPTEHELEFAARTGGGRTVPTGLVGDPSRTGSSTLELHAVDADPLDVSRPGSEAIHGLFGNASELTLFHYRPYPSLRFLRVRNDAWNGIAVRSGWISGGEILPTAPRLLGDLGRASQLPSQASVHVGFRCARSVRPWTETGPPHFKIQE